jgi:hypothetical protein
LTATANGWDERYINTEIERIGWSVSGGQDLCDNCIEEDKNGY